MPPRNRLLAELPRQELEAISPDLERVELPMKKVLHEPLEPITQVYFVERGVVSLVFFFKQKTAYEIATVGREGMVGFPVLLGTHTVPSRAFVQIPGEALRMKTPYLERA